MDGRQGRRISLKGGRGCRVDISPARVPRGNVSGGISGEVHNLSRMAGYFLLFYQFQQNAELGKGSEIIMQDHICQKATLPDPTIPIFPHH